MEELKKIRKKIDNIDHKIIDILHERMALLPKIVEAKDKIGQSREDPKREETIMKDRVKHAHSLRPAFVEMIFTVIMEESKDVQNEISQAKK